MSPYATNATEGLASGRVGLCAPPTGPYPQRIKMAAPDDAAMLVWTTERCDKMLFGHR